MLSELLNKLEGKSTANMIVGPTNPVKRTAKAIGYGLLIGTIETATIVGATVILASTAVLIVSPFLKEKE